MTIRFPAVQSTTWTSSWNGAICPTCRTPYIDQHDCPGDPVARLEAENADLRRKLARAKRKLRKLARDV